MTLRLLTVLAAVTVLAAQQQAPVFRGGVTFVNVDVYPREAGQVVEGLSKEGGYASSGARCSRSTSESRAYWIVADSRSR